MRKRTIIKKLPDGSMEITTVSQGCVVNTLSWIGWIWLAAFVVLAPARMGWWAIPLYTIEVLIAITYVNKRVTDARAKKPTE
jgi:hypothetical protein